MNSLVLAASLLGATAAGLAVLKNYRIGLMLLIFLVPFSSTQLIPRQLGGITGLNPVNLLLVVVAGSLFAVCAVRHNRVRVPRFSPLYWGMLLPFLLAGLVGLVSADQIPAAVAETVAPGGAIDSSVGFASAFIVKPLILVGVSMLVAIGCASSDRPARLLNPLLCSLLAMALLIIGHVLLSGLTLAQLSDSTSRSVFSWTGMHANELGLLLNTGLALTAFMSNDSSGRSQLLLRLLSILTALAVLLTFSRGAMLGLAIIVIFFTYKQRGLRAGVLSLIIVAATIAVLPQELYSRALHGVAEGDTSAVSAGRIDDIWIPLLPHVAENFMLGSGVGSVMWSPQIKAGQIMPVGHPHNAYLGLILDFGVIGAVLIAAFWVRAWKLFRSVATGAHGTPLGGFCEGAAVAIFVLAVQGVTDDKFTPTFAQSYIWLSFGIALGLHSARRHNVVSQPMPVSNEGAQVP